MHGIIKNKGFHYGYVIVFCCVLIMAINVGLVTSCAGIFYKPVSEELGVTVGNLGLYMSFNFLFSALTLFVAGRMIERFSIRLLLSVSSLVMGGCLISMAFFNSVWQFYVVAGGVIGITLSFLLYLSFPVLINRWFNVRVGFFIGICSAAASIGGILFNPLGAYWITEYGWRITYGIFGTIVLLVVTPVIWFLLRDYPEDKGLQPYGADLTGKEVQPKEGIEYAKAIRMPEFYGLILFAFMMILVSTLHLLIPVYVTKLDFSLEVAGFVAAGVMAGGTLGKIALGTINDRNNKLGILTSSGLGVVGFFLLLNGHFAGLWSVVAGGFLFGWAYAGTTVQTMMLVRTVFGSKNYAQIYSKVSIALPCGGILAAAEGLLADKIGYASVFGLAIVLLLLSACIGFFVLRKKFY